MNDLNATRTRIAELDRQILALVSERLEAARHAGRLKRAAGVPLRDWDREKQVLEQAAAQAEALGLAPAFVRSLMQAIVTASRAAQEQADYSGYAGDRHEIAILGGAGRMGRWFAEFFTNQGHGVRIYDPARPDACPTPAAALDGAACVLIATPLEDIPRQITALVEHGFRGVAFDIASLKSHLAPAVAEARAAGLRYTSIHPMFGPDAQSLADAVICVCDCGDAGATATARAFFEQTAASLVDLSMAHHDEIIAYVLGLSHAVNIVIARALMRSGLSYETLSRISSTTFHSQMQTTATVIREQPELYYAIQKLNAFTPAMYGTLRTALEEVTGLVQAGHRDAFVHLMQTGRQWMDAP